ncbi:hypothetical protein OKW28_004051 [Paraburkholderia sp. 40]
MFSCRWATDDAPEICTMCGDRCGSYVSATYIGVAFDRLFLARHWVEPETGEVFNRSIKRAAFLEHFANRAPCLIGMEMCSRQA